MKKIYSEKINKSILLLFVQLFVSVLFSLAFAQPKRILHGEVRSVANGSHMAGVSVAVKGTVLNTLTDREGRFSILVEQEKGTLLFSHVGYVTKEVNYEDLSRVLEVSMEYAESALEEVEVVSTGYFQIPKERATGAFSVLNADLLDRSPSMNILERMEGLTSSLQFNRKDATNERRTESEIRIRGVSSINSDTSPLIILDEFPYEGDITSINPENIESITILKDAAASSIWGARAGNGVIVITTKKGSFNSKQKINYESRFLFINKPDMYYDKQRLPSQTVLEIEDRLFDQKIHTKQDRLALPYYVDLKFQLQDGLITKDEFDRERLRLENIDVRDEANRYLYRNGVQYLNNLGFSGGSSTHRYNVNISHSKEKRAIIGDDNDRIVLDFSNGFNLWKGAGLQLSGGYSQQKKSGNGVSLSELTTGGIGVVSTYTQLKNEVGYLPIVRDYNWTYVNSAESNGLMDWRYYPLAERELIDKTSQINYLRFSPQFTYDFLKDWQVRINYQYQQSTNSGINHYGKDSYYVRNMVNRFTQQDGTRIIPHGDILNYAMRGQQKTQALRFQLGYNTVWKDKHQLNALMGTERREGIFENEPSIWVYDYDPDLRLGTAQFDFTKYYPNRPAGGGRVPGDNLGTQKNVDRDISYYSNLSYSYDGRFVLTNSLRWDASNLFGVKTNQKGVPLWSIGGAWNMDRELFLAESIFSRLKLRATYGVSGNVNKNVSAYPTVSYGTNVETNLPMAALSSVGNPSLRWEKVKTTNLGLDLGLGQELYGSVDYYIKKGEDLLGLDYMDPTSGISGALRQMVNYANIETKGLDVDLTFHKNFSNLKWTTNVLGSIVNNRITHYSTNDNLKATAYLLGVGTAPPKSDKPVDILYALPWRGLSPENGLPLVLIDGEQSSDYNNYVNNFPVDDLIDVGVTIPRYHGFLRTSIAWKSLEIGGMVSWKGGYKYRKNSMMPGGEYQGNGQHHMDYFKRWEKPGDEKNTFVPAVTDKYSSPLANAYRYAEVLVEPATNIRWEDLILSYNYSILSNKLRGKVGFMVRNLGIIWKQSKSDEDPDQPYAIYSRPREFNINIQIQF